MGTKILVFAVLLAAQQIPTPPSPEKVTGRVLSVTGEALAGVKVYGGLGKCCPFRNEEATTNEKGEFALLQPTRIVFARHGKYRPTSKLLNGREQNIELILEPAARTTWTIPVCSASNAREKRVGGYFRFSMPQGAETKEGSDIDYKITYVRKKDEKTWLALWNGPMVARPLSYEDLLLKTSSYEERWVEIGEGGGWAGVDVRGETGEGKKWRWANLLVMDLASYEGASEETAAFLDTIVDSVCFDKKAFSRAIGATP